MFRRHKLGGQMLGGQMLGGRTDARAGQILVGTDVRVDIHPVAQMSWFTYDHVQMSCLNHSHQ